MKSLTLIFYLFALAFYPILLKSQNDVYLIEQTSNGDVSLDKNSRLKIIKQKNNSKYDSTWLVKLGNLKTLENSGAIPFKLPGIHKPIVAQRERMRVDDEKNYIWRGNFKSE